MSIYSRRLGQLNAGGVIYTCPAGGGPCIIKGASWQASLPTSSGALFIPVGPVNYQIDSLPPSTPAVNGVFHSLWAVLQPGDTLNLEVVVGVIKCMVWGQQFASP